MDKIDKSKLNILAENIKSCITEGVFTYRWALIEMAHSIGQMITEFAEQEQVSMSSFLTTLSQKVGRDERTLYRAARIYKNFPDISKIPDGKNASLNKLNNLLADPKENKEERCYHCPIKGHCL